MTIDELEAAFERYTDGDEFLAFERIAKPAHRRPDICAFIMLDAAVEKRMRNGAFGDMVRDAGHDVIYLDTDPEDLAAVATDDMIRDLVRCGVRYSDGHLEMFT